MRQVFGSPKAGEMARSRRSLGGDVAGPAVKSRQRRSTIAGNSGTDAGASGNASEYAKWSKAKCSEQGRLLADATEVASRRILRSRAFAAALPVPEASDARFAPVDASHDKPNLSMKDLALSRASSAAAIPQTVAPATPSPASSFVPLQEESMRLREVNLTLREEGFALKQDLEVSRAAREALSQEIVELQAQRELEREQLDHCRQQRCRLKDKLKRCCEVVAFTVGSVDRLQVVESAVDVSQGGVRSEQDERAILLLVTEVQEAGCKAARCLESLEHENAEQANDQNIGVDVESYDDEVENQENRDGEHNIQITPGGNFKEMKKQPECHDLRSPLRSLNARD